MSKITITILGTSAGVPTKTRAHPAIHLSYDDGVGECLLFDCGENTQRQFMSAGLNIMKIDNIFLTHWHGDHCLGVPGLVDTMGFEDRRSPLSIYAPEVNRLKKGINFNYSMGKFRIFPHNVVSRGKGIRKIFDTKRFYIASTPVKHSIPSVSYALIEKDKTCIDLKKANSLGLPEKGEIYGELKKRGKIRLEGRDITFEDISIVQKGKKIVYSGDTEICDNLVAMVKGADLLIQDCTYFDDVEGTRPHKHASLSEIKDMVKENDVKKIILTHISRKYQDPEQLQKLIKDYPQFILAEDFMEITV